MNKDLLQKHVTDYLAHLKATPDKYSTELQERADRSAYYRSWTTTKLAKMTKDDLTEYLSKLWAMRIWGNKQYVVDQLIADNTLPSLVEHLTDLVWSSAALEKRWDNFRKHIKGMGPAMMSEILCHAHPDTCMLWNRRAYVGLNYLGVKDLPRHNYQLTGRVYAQLCAVTEAIAEDMRAMGVKQANLLTVDYFIWDELQVEENLSKIHKPKVAASSAVLVEKVDAATSAFIHDEVRDKIVDIGRWLGLQADKEKKVADGAKVDAIWEATIGNMGRVIYVFEVQTKGSIDSLLMNLLKSLNNPAVQGVVAVSDAAQLGKIKAEAAGVTGLKDKLKFWDYTEVLDVHEALESVNDAINSLGLVPQGF
jgi:hypothetical protein